jgi:O-antigen ligase
MDERRKKAVLAALLAPGLAIGVYAACSRPGMFSNTVYLGRLIFLELLVVALFKFRQLFFIILMIGFLWAGLNVPMSTEWTSGRWALLTVGAVAGLLVFSTQPQHRYGVFHLVAVVGLLVSFLSAAISDVPAVSALKALSLLLMFVYAAGGGRVAIVGREQRFVAGLLLGCEIIVCGSVLSYSVLGLSLWGNPNSLGLAMAITSPVLLWGTIVSKSRAARGRRVVVFVAALALLIWSNSRAGMFSSAVAMVALGIALRKNRALVQGIAGVVCLLSLLAIVAPSTLKTLVSESEDTLIYKGKREEGFLGSRTSPWQQTMDSIQRHPWFGSGFGVSLSEQGSSAARRFASYSETSREHGSSYLALLEWFGVLGSIPFFSLVLILFGRLVQVTRWLYRTGYGSHAIVPLLLVLLTGLVHASLEDWLFAVGYYATVFFWTVAFSFIDLAPALTPAHTHPTTGWTPRQVAADRLGMMTSTR